MVTQLYTKNLGEDGKPYYEKVNWNLLKVTPNYKILEAIVEIMKKNRPNGEFVDGYRALAELKQILGLK